MHTPKSRNVRVAKVSCNKVNESNLGELFYQAIRIGKLLTHRHSSQHSKLYITDRKKPWRRSPVCKVSLPRRSSAFLLWSEWVLRFPSWFLWQFAANLYSKKHSKLLITNIDQVHIFAFNIYSFTHLTIII